MGEKEKGKRREEGVKRERENDEEISSERKEGKEGKEKKKKKKKRKK